MTRRSRRRFNQVAPLLVCALLGATVWKVRAELQRIRLSRQLIDAIRAENVAAVKSLLDRGADANTRRSLYQEAEPKNLLDLLRMRFQLHPAPQITQEDRYTALALAMEREPGAMVDKSAANERSAEMVRLLLEHGADVNAIGLCRMTCWSDPPHGTALMMAVTQANDPCIRLLLDRGAMVNATDDFGMTALIYIAGKNDVEGMKLLLDRGANVNIQSKDGDFALREALYGLSTSRLSYRTPDYQARLSAFRLLMAKGADVHMRDSDGCTPLVWAAGSAEMVDALLARGADINAPSNDGTPLIYAARDHNLQGVKILMDRGADVNAQSNLKNDRGQTALEIALDEHLSAMAALLKKAGATPR